MMNMPTSLLLIASGGAIGAVARYLTMSAVGRMFGVIAFPYGTLTVNIVGSLIMGIMIALLAKQSDGGQGVHLFFAVGVLGSFTTFSTFSLDVVTMYERGELMSVLIYIVASVLLSIFALFGGLALMRSILS